LREGAVFEFIEEHDAISVMANETEQKAIKRRSWAGFINAEISAFGLMAILNAEKYAFNSNAYVENAACEPAAIRTCDPLQMQHFQHMAVKDDQLSKRERQAMDIVYRLGKATAEEIQEEMPDSPSYSAVRALLSILVGKKLLKHTRESRRYVYELAISREKARDTALRKIMRTFFDGSPGKLVASLLETKDRKLPPEEIAAIRKLLDEQSPS
jgi:predicted transcriptional regulator